MKTQHQNPDNAHTTPVRRIALLAALTLVVAMPFHGNALVGPAAAVVPSPPVCDLLVPSNGHVITCTIESAGAFDVQCSGVWSHATWVHGAQTDCAWSGEPNAAWGSECAIHPGGGALGHGFRVNDQQPFHANRGLFGEDMAYVNDTNGDLLMSFDVACDWDEHTYHATYFCSVAPCELALRISDGFNPRDYSDNAGSLSVRVSPTTVW